MILGFKPQFVEPILNFKKIHSIRIDQYCRWKPGIKIHFATGVRTKNYNNFLIGTCDSVQKIEMDLSLTATNIHSDCIVVDNHELFEFEMLDLAKNDGFKDYVEFKKWFLNMNGNCFEGRIIHWTSKKY